LRGILSHRRGLAKSRTHREAGCAQCVLLIEQF
jgi:hypothetical protein